MCCYRLFNSQYYLCLLNLGMQSKLLLLNCSVLLIHNEKSTTDYIWYKDSIRILNWNLGPPWASLQSKNSNFLQGEGGPHTSAVSVIVKVRSMQFIVTLGNCGDISFCVIKNPWEQPLIIVWVQLSISLLLCNVKNVF